MLPIILGFDLPSVSACHLFVPAFQHPTCPAATITTVAITMATRRIAEKSSPQDVTTTSGSEKPSDSDVTPAVPT